MVAGVDYVVLPAREMTIVYASIPYLDTALIMFILLLLVEVG